MEKILNNIIDLTFDTLISELTAIGVNGLDVKLRRNRVLFRILNSWERRVTL